MDEWLQRRGHTRGATASPQTLYQLGADWYRTRLDVSWEPSTAREAEAIFARHGLVGEFWSLDS